MRTPSELERAYLATDEPRAQSGFHGSAGRWEATRLRDLGLEAAGKLYRRSDEHQVEIAVAWVDQD